MNPWTLVESIHGHLGVLAAAALLHPAILLRDGRPLSRGIRWSLGLTSAVTAGAFGLGLTIYEPYRAQVKRPLFVESPDAGWLFETKEHLAYVVLALTVGATVCALAAPRRRRALRRLAALLFAAASAVCLAVVGLGTYLAAVRGFSG